MADFLKQMAALSAERAAAVTHCFREHELDLPLPRLSLAGFGVIAEIKEHSPSEGRLAVAGNDRLERARHYAEGGAAAVSVLTEPSRFGGELEHLREIAAMLAGLGIPAMRKDFLVERVQLLEARAAGAGGVLLITAMLDDDALADLLDCAADLGLFVLLEAFDEDDLERTRRLLERPRYGDMATGEQLLVGVNTRNLRTLEVDGERLARLAPLLPGAATCVAESGLASAADAATAAALGYRIALVGSALMRSADPAALIRDMRTAGGGSLAA